MRVAFDKCWRNTALEKHINPFCLFQLLRGEMEQVGLIGSEQSP